MRDQTSAASMFARLSRELNEEQSEPPRLQTVCERAVTIVPACDYSSLTLRKRRNRVESIAATHDLALQADTLQYDLDEGPCLQAVWHDDYYLTPNTSTDSRWPRWGPKVAEIGIHSVLSIQLATASEKLGSLNLYAASTDAFGRDDVDLAVIFAVHATIAVSSARLVSGLQTAMQSRHLIGVAQGILMNKYHLDLEKSFEVLRRYSGAENVKLREVAEFVIEHRNLPGGGDHRPHDPA